MAMNGSGVDMRPAALRPIIATTIPAPTKARERAPVSRGSSEHLAGEVRSQHKRQDDRDRVLENRREDDRRHERGENAAADTAHGKKKVVLGQLLR